MFSGGIKVGHCLKMGQNEKLHKCFPIRSIHPKVFHGIAGLKHFEKYRRKHLPNSRVLGGRLLF